MSKTRSQAHPSIAGAAGQQLLCLLLDAVAALFTILNEIETSSAFYRFYLGQPSAFNPVTGAETYLVPV